MDAMNTPRLRPKFSREKIGVVYLLTVPLLFFVGLGFWVYQSLQSDGVWGKVFDATYITATIAIVAGTLLHYFRGAYHVAKVGSLIKYQNIFNHWVLVEFDAITDMKVSWWNKFDLNITYQINGNEKTFTLNAKLVDFGELIEIILSNSTNLRTINLSNLPATIIGGELAWGKTPDWTIINTAKRRAEENRKKAQSPAPQASPAASAPPLAGGAPVRAEGDTTPPPL